LHNSTRCNIITFLPFDDYDQSARVLDDARLGKQRAEVKAIWKMISDETFQNQPLVKMWKDHVWWLMEYGKACCKEWTRRGFEDNLYHFFDFVQRGSVKGEKPSFGPMLHASMRANLLRKDERFYRRFGWSEAPQEGYDWPVMA
jgi:hypothetical protein